MNQSGPQRRPTVLRRLDCALPQSARHRPRLRPAGRPHPADLGPRRAQGIRIIDVRDEGAAVHMAHAHAELTGGFGVAMVTAGPGVTNTVTAMANASLARAPVLLIGGCTSRPQANMGPLQDIPHVDILRPVTRTARTLARRRAGDPRARRGGGARHGRCRRARPGLHRNSDRRAARPRAAAARARRMDAGQAAAPAAARSGGDRRGGRGVLGGEAPAGHHRARRARRRRRWCACSMPPARSISTRRKAAAWCRPIIPRSPPRCAPPP